MHKKLEACNRKHVASFDISALWERQQRLDSDIRGTSGWANFSTELKKIQELNRRFLDFMYSILIGDKMELQIT